MSILFKENKINKSIKINGEIKAKELRVIGLNGQQIGIMELSEAQKLANEAGVDLIEISPNATPPVAKIIDWNKYQYQKTKEQQKNRKKSKTADLKQMRIGLKIGDHDLNIKIRKITNFLKDGHKVKIMIYFRGREIAHQDLGHELLNKVLLELGDKIINDQKPQINGRNLSVIVRSK